MNLSIVSPFSTIHVNHEFWALRKDSLLICAGASAVTLGIIGASVAGPFLLDLQ